LIEAIPRETRESDTSAGPENAAAEAFNNTTIVALKIII